jgi:hypothetical protein
MAVNKFDNSMFDAGTIGTTANKLLQLDGSTKIPAVDGSLLTGIPSSFTKSASDPAIATNPSGGVGTIWVNTTSGETYCCTDATAGANVWTNVGAGSGNIQPWLFQGTNYGYHFGAGPDYSPNNGSLQKISFASDGNSTNVANNTQGRDTWSGCSSETYGYCCGGYNAGTLYNIIDKFAFLSDTSFSDVGDLIATNRTLGSSNNATYGYCHGGYPAHQNVIQRFQMVATANATDVGDLTVARSFCGGNSDVGNDYGYATGGYHTGQANNYGGNQIDRYAMASSGNAVDVGDMHTERASHASHSTETYGYQAGGGEPSATNAIRKFAFGSSVTSTDVADLTVARFDTTGMSSTTYGYSAGGIWPDSLNTTIDKYSFAADANATDVGDLVMVGGRYNGPVGAQY